MNVALVYAAFWGVLGAWMWRAGDRPAASVLAGQAIGCAALWPFIGVHPYWPVIGATIFLAAAAHQQILSINGKISPVIPILGYALAGSYVFHVVGGVRDALARAWLTPTWLSAALGIAIAAFAAGPTARDWIGDIGSHFRRGARLGVGADDGV